MTSLKLHKNTVLFCIGGLIYILCELLCRGFSHWTMFLLGGFCFLLVGAINNIISWNMPLILQMLIGAGIITSLEFITGCIVNLWLGWNVWDYSQQPFNLLGQICLKSSIIWFWLSGVAIILDDYLKYWWYHERKPRYTIWRWGS